VRISAYKINIKPTKWQKIIFTYALINLCLGLLYLLPFYAYNTLSLWKITGNDNSIFDLNSSNYFLAFSLLYLALFLCLVGGLVIVLALRKFFSWPAMILFLSPLPAYLAPLSSSKLTDNQN
jgi:hypothetical protein